MSTPRPDHPAGAYVSEPFPSSERRRELIEEIEQFPKKLQALVADLSEAQLDTPYKLWTVRQIVHHLADSHLNAYDRTKLALTEENPTIKPYDESRWSRLPDALHGDPESSLIILDGLHARWVMTFRALTDAEFDRTFFHPELARAVRVAELIGMYAWHGRHHGAMIEWLRADGGWGRAAW